VLCTFDFDPDRFNASVFPELTRRGRQFRTLVIADACELQEKLQCLTRPTFARYAIAPARIRRGGVFHPKILLLRCGEHILVGIGSANLTPGGLGGNLELMLFADHTSREGRALAQGVAAFLDRLMECRAVVLPRDAASFVRTTIADMERSDGTVLHTLQEALLPQMARLRPAVCGKVTTSLDVLSPWHSDGANPDNTDPKTIALLRKSFSVTGPVKVFTQGVGGFGPDLGKRVEVLIPTRTSADDAETDDASEDDERVYDRRPTRLHAKAYLARGPRGNLFLFGSANCTVPALSRSVLQGGNVEVLVASRLSDADVRSLNNDLAHMFVQADALKACEPCRRANAPRGAIILGQVVGANGRTVLRVEAPGVTFGDIAIAAKRNARAVVRVAIQAGIGTVGNTADLNELFPGGMPGRASDSWSSVLWERQSRYWIPFPVIVPLLDTTSGQGDAALVEILEEECGWWPPSSRGEPDDDVTGGSRPPQDDNDEEEDKDIWTAAVHQGELDRIAVAVALLRKRMTRTTRFGSPKAVQLYAASLMKRIEAVALEEHLGREVKAFLQRSLSARSKKR
jgi:hypothetical protein